MKKKHFYKVSQTLATAKMIKMWAIKGKPAKAFSLTELPKISLIVKIKSTSGYSNSIKSPKINIKQLT